MLLLIWTVSFVLALVAILTLLLMLGRRLHMERRERRERQEIETFKQALNEALRNSQSPDRFPALTPAVALVLDRILFRLPTQERRRALERLPHRRLDQLLEALLEQDEDTAVAALFSTRLLPITLRVSALRHGLGHASHHVRLAAAELLVDCEGEPSVAAIVRAVLPDARALPSVQAARVLRRLGPRGMDYWARLLTADDTPRGYRVAAVLALAEVSGTRSFQLLRQALTAAGTAERAAAWHGLASQRDARAQGHVPYALKDSQWRVRCEAARYVERLHLQQYRAPLEGLLAAPVWQERYAAAGALAALGDTGLRRLRQIMREDNERGRVARAVLAEYRSL